MNLSQGPTSVVPKKRQTEFWALAPASLRSVKSPLVQKLPDWPQGRKAIVNIDELRSRYLSLPDFEKQIFLLSVSWYLTIHGRSFGLDLMGEEQTRAFLGLNELHHQISSHVISIALGHNRYPDDSLWNILNEKAAHYGISAHLKSSFEFAQTRALRKEPG
jgi:hypothetical protein